MAQNIIYSPWEGTKSPWQCLTNPLQYSCLENPKDRGAWWTIGHGVEKSETQLKWLSTHAQKLND